MLHSMGFTLKTKCNMNITFQFELNTSNASMEGRVLIRCTQNRKHKRISTGVAVSSKYWDKTHHRVKGSHPLSKELNNLIHEKLRKVTDAYSGLLSENEEVALDDLILKITAVPMTNFFDFVYSTKLAEIKSGEKLGTYRKYESVVNKFKAFTGSRLRINQVNYSLLQKYMLHLKHHYNNSQDTISSNLSVLRVFINEAIKHDLYRGRNPYEQLKLKYTDNSKEKLTAEELRRVFRSQLPPSHSFQIARDFFLACFLAEGTRGGDMIGMKKEYIINGCLVFNQQKTGSKMVIPITDELMTIFEKYMSDEPYIFPLLNKEMVVNEIIIGNKLAYINKYLKEVAKYCGILKKLSTHVARHTYTDLALKVTNGNIYEVQKSLGHSSVKTTELYSKNRVNYDKVSLLPKILMELKK
ncbi:MAG: site-specific integrase [Ferruginibacter sp.]|nr:site-specific integrase [Ferruginibacter sp.]